ncbi:uncharacterized protein LOC144503048 [Mustelus asterias]
MRPVRLRALTSNTDGGGGFFLLEDLDVSDLYQLENETLRKWNSCSEQDSDRCLPVIQSKRVSVHPAKNLSLRQPSVHLTGMTHNCPSSSHLHRTLGLSSKAPDIKMERTGKSSLMEQNRFQNRKIQVSCPPQDCQKVLRPAKHSNVHITMLYLGRELKIPARNTEPRDELKVYQQICGAETICVYKGHLTRREQFQFASRRHFGFPFSATIYVNGMVAARISWCCEHKYPSGFQQGKLSCFRVIRVRGGTPCYRCLMAPHYRQYRRNQTPEEACPGIKGDLTFEDDGSENGITPKSGHSSFRSERGGKITVSDGTPSHSDPEMLKSKQTPACSGKGRSNQKSLYDGMQQKIKLNGGWMWSEVSKVNNTMPSPGSDGGDWMGEEERSVRKILKKKLCPRLKRVDSAEGSSQTSTGNENTARGLLEARHWKRDSFPADKSNFDQGSEDSNDSGRGRSVRKKRRKKRIRRRAARKDAEGKDRKFVDRVTEDVGKMIREKERRQKEPNDLEDGDVVSVTRNEAVGDGCLRNGAGTLDNHPNSLEGAIRIVEDTGKVFGNDIQVQNSTINNKETPIKDRLDVMQQVSMDKESADQRQEDVSSRELKKECKEENIQRSNSENAERLSKKINQQPETQLDKDKQFSKDELAVWVRERLVSAIQGSECVRSEAELSDSSEASKSEERQDSEEETKNPTHGQTGIDGGVDEIDQLSPNGLMRNKNSVYTGQQDDGLTASNKSPQPTQTEACDPTYPQTGQTRGSLSETNSQEPCDVVTLAFANRLKGGCGPCHFPGNRSATMGNEGIRGGTFPAQKVKGRGEIDERHTLQMPLPTLANPSGAITHVESEDKQTSPSDRSNLQPPDHLTLTNDPAREPTQCNVENRDGHTGSKPETCTVGVKSRGTEQLLAKPTPENKEADETTLIISPWGQHAAGMLRKQVRDTVTVLQACQSVGQLILRNTGLTDDLLETLVSTLINSQSEVETINLNLNNLGPHSAQLLVQLLKAKPSVKCLLLYGNKLGDKGIGTLTNGLIDLFTAEKAEETRASVLVEQPLPRKRRLQLAELDIGSNQLTNEGLRSVAKFLRLNPPLEYLGLSRNVAVDLTGWCELFDILKDNGDVSHLLLDENVLGNEGAKYLAEVLRVNGSLRKVDLDWNEIGDKGGLALAEAMSFNPRRSLVHLSLDGNELSIGVKKELKALLSENKQGRLHLCTGWNYTPARINTFERGSKQLGSHHGN